MSAPLHGDDLAGLRLDDEGRPLLPGGLKVVAVFDFACAALLLAAGVGVARLMPWGHGPLAEAPVAAAAGAFVAVLLLGAPLHAAAAIGVLRMRSWGRWLQVVVSGLGLVLAALGLYLHLITFVYLVLPGMRHVFARRPVAGLSPDEARSLRAVAGGKATAILIVALGLSVLGAAAVSGIVVGIAAPNFLNAVQRGKQKRTMGDIRTVATAIESYSLDHREYPTATDVQELAAALEPTYVRLMPRADGWGHELRVDSGPMGYVLVSPGKDGTFETAVPRAYAAGPTSTFGSDIVFSNGSFVRYPQGPQAAP